MQFFIFFFSDFSLAKQERNRKHTEIRLQIHLQLRNLPKRVADFLSVEVEGIRGKAKTRKGEKETNDREVL